MLQDIRDKSKGPILTFIVVLVCLMFAATGVDSILGSSSSGNVAKVNGEKITEQELNEAIFLQKRKILSQMGENVDPSMLEDKKLREPAIDDLVQRKLLLQIADEQHMSIPDKEINRMIAENPDFHVDGKFSNDTFRTVIANAGLTPAIYKKLFSTDVLMSQVSSGIAETGFVTEKESSINTRFTHQARDIRYITLSLEKAKAGLAITEEEARAYYDKHPADFLTEENIVVEYIELNLSAIKADVTDDEIKQAYDLEMANFKSGEQREVSHILVHIDSDTTRDQARQQLLDLKSRIQGGEDFAEVARSHSEDLGSKESGGLLGLMDKDAYPEAFVAAASSLAEGQLSDVVETDAGLHLIKINSISVARQPTLEERKEDIRTNLLAVKTRPLYLEQLEKLKDLAFNTPDLSEPADAIDAKIQESPAFSRQGASGIFANKKLLKEAFSDNVVKNGENSEVIELSPTQAVVLRLKQHNPPRQLDFAEVKARATDLALAEKAKAELDKLAGDVKNGIAAGKNVEAVAKEHSLAWNILLSSKRTNPEADQEVVDVAFRLPVPSTSQIAMDMLEKSNGDRVVVVVDKVTEGDSQEFKAMEMPIFRSFLARSAAMEELSAMEAGIKAKAEIVVY